MIFMLQLKRLGPQHQAGSDARLTGLAFFKMREVSPDSVTIVSIPQCIVLGVPGTFSH